MWDKIKAWFKSSETIFWARLQMLLGIVWGVLTAADLSPLLTQKQQTLWFIGAGIVTEVLRRRNDPAMKKAR